MCYSVVLPLPVVAVWGTLAKGYLSPCNMPSFRMQKVTFCILKGYLLQEHWYSPCARLYGSSLLSGIKINIK